MNCLTRGHVYELHSFEGERTQLLRFIEKEQVDGVLETVADGTTNEEVLAVLIDRMHHLQDMAPCRENAIVITKLQEALMWLDKRTADRQARGVEGTPEK